VFAGGYRARALRGSDIGAHTTESRCDDGETRWLFAATLQIGASILYGAMFSWLFKVT